FRTDSKIIISQKIMSASIIADIYMFKVIKNYNTFIHNHAHLVPFKQQILNNTDVYLTQFASPLKSNEFYTLNSNRQFAPYFSFSKYSSGSHFYSGHVKLICINISRHFRKMS